jgi:hypothetical protein
LNQGLLQLLVLGLLGQDVQTPHHGQTGVDHGCKLATEHGQRLLVDLSNFLIPAKKVRLRNVRGLLFDVNDGHALLLQTLSRQSDVLRLDGVLLQLAGCITGLVNEYRHPTPTSH